MGVRAKITRYGDGTWVAQRAGFWAWFRPIYGAGQSPEAAYERLLSRLAPRPDSTVIYFGRDGKPEAS